MSASGAEFNARQAHGPRTHLVALVILAGTLRVGLVEAQPIHDPENPGAQPIHDPENPGIQTIHDPENPGIQTIHDPEDASLGGGGPGPGAAPFVSVTSFRGQLRALTAMDVARDPNDEHTLETQAYAGLVLTHRFSARWSARLEGRLRWTMLAQSREGNPPIAVTRDSWEGRVEPDIGQTYLSFRRDAWSVRVGTINFSWGSTDITRPSDTINPRDLRLGPLASRDETKIPVFATDLGWATRHWELQWLVVPVFVPHRADLYGSDNAMIRDGGIIDAPGAGALFRSAIDPSLRHLAQPLLVQTSLPRPTPENASVGARATARYGGADISAGYMFGWDRTPRVALSPAGRRLLDAFQDGIDGSLDGEQFGALLEAQQSIDEGNALIDARHLREHRVSVDGVRYFGPVGVRAESTWSPAQTFAVSDIRTVRRAQIASALGLSYESSGGRWLVVVEGFHGHVFRRDADGEFALHQDRRAGIGTAIDVGLARSANRVRLRSLLLLQPRHGDYVFSPSVRWAVDGRLDVDVGAMTIGTWGTSSRSLGAVFSNTDQVYVRGTWAF